MAGASLVSIPVEHQHIALAAVAGHELPRDLPCFRDPDYLVYGKSEAGGVLFGGYEHDPVGALARRRALGAQRPERAGRRGALRAAHAGRRAALPVPRRRGRRQARLPSRRHDARWQPARGRAAGRARPLRRGRPLAQRLRRGGRHRQGGGRARHGGRERARSAVLPAVALRRGAPRPLYAAETAREAYRYYYRLRYPLDSDVLGRPRRTSALHERMQDAGAVFAVKNGWERADYCRPGQPWRRAGEEQRAFGWAEPPVCRGAGRGVGRDPRARRDDRHDVVRQDRGRGAGSGALLERVCDAHVDRAAGQRRLLAVPQRARRHRRGRHGHAPRPSSASASSRARPRSTPTSAGCGCTPSDGRRARRAARRDGRAVRDRHVGTARAHRPGGRDRRRRLRRRVPVRERAQPRRWEGRRVWAQRITYVGELGYELYAEPAWGVQVWDRLAAAGSAPTGSGRSATACSTRCAWRRATARSAAISRRATRPTRRASASASRSSARASSSGAPRWRRERRARLRAPPAHAARRRRAPRSSSTAARRCWRTAVVVGRVRSAAYGYTVGRTIASAYLPLALADGHGRSPSRRSGAGAGRARRGRPLRPRATPACAPELSSRHAAASSQLRVL